MYVCLCMFVSRTYASKLPMYVCTYFVHTGRYIYCMPISYLIEPDLIPLPVPLCCQSANPPPATTNPGLYLAQGQLSLGLRLCLFVHEDSLGQLTNSNSFSSSAHHIPFSRWARRPVQIILMRLHLALPPMLLQGMRLRGSQLGGISVWMKSHTWKSKPASSRRHRPSPAC